MTSVYYNDNDKHCCEWLQNLVNARLLAEGTVDNRSIKQVSRLQGFNRVHLFAGIGGWEYALQLAGWPVDVPVWTGSCPCQPFSIAGKQKGKEDERHLWPEMLRLIKESGIDFVFGEQVASPDGRAWLAGVQIDLEALGYTFGAADLCAAGINAPHIRQRLYWVAYAESKGRCRGSGTLLSKGCSKLGGSSIDLGEVEDEGLGVSSCGRDGKASLRSRIKESAKEGGQCSSRGPSASSISGVGYTDRTGTRRDDGAAYCTQGASDCCGESTGCDSNSFSLTGFWDDAEFIPCRDPKRGTVYRRVKPGMQPLVDGISFQLADGRSRKNASRAQILRGIGNAIVPELAATFIKSFMESVGMKC